MDTEVFAGVAGGARALNRIVEVSLRYKLLVVTPFRSSPLSACAPY